MKMAVSLGGLWEECQSQACKDVQHSSVRRNSPCFAILGGSEVDFVKKLDEFLTQGVGVCSHMWVGVLSLMNPYLVNHCVPDTKNFCRGSFAAS